MWHGGTHTHDSENDGLGAGLDAREGGILHLFHQRLFFIVESETVSAGFCNGLTAVSAGVAVEEVWTCRFWTLSERQIRRFICKCNLDGKRSGTHIVQSDRHVHVCLETRKGL